MFVNESLFLKMFVSSNFFYTDNRILVKKWISFLFIINMTIHNKLIFHADVIQLLQIDGNNTCRLLKPLVD